MNSTPVAQNKTSQSNTSQTSIIKNTPEQKRYLHSMIFATAGIGIVGLIVIAVLFMVLSNAPKSSNIPKVPVIIPVSTPVSYGDGNPGSPISAPQ